MTEGRKITEFTSMLGCRVRLHEFDHDGVSCVRLSLDVDDRHAEVLLNADDALTTLEGLSDWGYQG